jgi:hypothetical protein
MANKKENCMALADFQSLWNVKLKPVVATKTELQTNIKETMQGISSTTPTQTQEVMLFATDGTPTNRVSINQYIMYLIQTYGLGALTVICDTLPAAPAIGDENKVHRVKGTTSYSDYQWNGSEFVLLATVDMTGCLYDITKNEFDEIFN